MWQSVVEFLIQGGITMVPLLGLSVAALAVSVERFWALRTRQVMGGNLAAMVHEQASRGAWGEAETACSLRPSSLGRIYQSALAHRQLRPDDLRQAVTFTGRQEQLQLGRFLPFITAVVGAGPLLGLLGTVTGMIKTFGVIKIQGMGVTQSLAGGIAEALISTATGLVVAIPFFIVARLLEARVDYFTHRLEEEAEALIRHLKPFRSDTAA